MRLDVSPLTVKTLEGRERPAGTFFPGKAPGPLQSVSPQRFPEVRIGQGLAHLFGHCLRGRRVEEGLFPADDLRERRGVRRNDRRAASHRLQRWKAEALVERGKGEECTQVVKGDQIFVGDIARENHVARTEALPLGKRQESSPVVLVETVDDHKLIGLPYTFGQTGKGADQPFHVLPVFDSPGIGYKRPVDPVTAPEETLFFRADIDGAELRVEARADVHDAIPG